MFRYYAFKSDVRDSFIERVKSAKKSLNKPSENFINALFEGTDSSDYGDWGDKWVSDTSDALYRKDYVSLDDIFPSSIYPALDLLMGKELRVKFLQVCQRLPQYPYTVSYYRRTVRSQNYAHLFNKICSLLGDFIAFNLLNIDIMGLLKEQYDKDTYYSTFFFNEYCAIEIDNNNVEVIDFIRDLLLSQKNTSVLTSSVIGGIVASSNKELNDLLAGLLLASKLQEGLRQAICESMDSGLHENFVKLFNIIHDNNMVRFASVRRSIGTFTGIGEYEDDRVTKKEVALIYDLLNGNIDSKTLITSDDNVEALIGLWFEGSKDISCKIQGINQIIECGKHHSHLLVSYVLSDLQDDIRARKIAKNIIRNYCETNGGALLEEALQIVACFLPHISITYGYYDRDFKDVSFDDYYESCEEAKFFFNILKVAFNSFTKKTKTYSPCIFPWYKATISKDDLSKELGYIACLLKDDLITDEYTDYLTSYYDFGKVLSTLYSNPKTEKQKYTLVKLFGNRNFPTKLLYKIIKDNALTFEYIADFEGYLRLKTPEIRQYSIELLYKQNIDNLKITIDNLIQSKDENKRLGALELVSKAKEEKKLSEQEILDFIQKITSISSSEEVLIGKLLGSNNLEKALDNLYDKDYTPNVSLSLDIPIKAKNIFSTPTKKLLKIVKALNELYTEHEDYEYKTSYGEVILGNTFATTKPTDYRDRGDKVDLSYYPLTKVWEDFYSTHIDDYNTLLHLHLALNTFDLDHDDDEEECYFKIINKVLKTSLDELNSLLEKEDLKYFGSTWKNKQGKDVIEALYSDKKHDFTQYNFEIALSIINTIINKYPITKLSNSYLDWGKNKSYESIFTSIAFMTTLFNYLDKYTNDEDFIKVFEIKYYIDSQMQKLSKENNISWETVFLNIYEVAYAVHLGLVRVDFLYQYILANSKSNLEIISIQINDKYSITKPYMYKQFDNYYSKNEHSEKILEIHGQKIIDILVELELERGDIPLQHSSAIHSIKRIEGIENLVKVLKALGKLKLDRNTWYWSKDDSKKSTLSHLLKVSFPKESDSVDTLKEKLATTNIPVMRLVEVAMYAPQWIPIIEQYLGWQGLASGCYYFQAHTSDIEKKKESLFAKYTPISVDDLQNGAFDVDWFKSSYTQLGEENFNLLYESAKYISDGAKHSRARKFADATLGRIAIEDTEKAILDKRNQDLVKSYGLIPVAKNGEKDILHRYKFLQDFLKTSKQFGAGRRASEATSVSIALENLARNAGYSDATRLTWTMETKLIQESASFFAPKEIGDITVYIRIDENGKSEIVYEKDGKKLKSLPAKYKKDTYIEDLKQTHNNLKGQYVRSKKMLEEAMEDEVTFHSEEISNLLENNLIISPLLRNLVFKAGEEVGYFENEKLIVLYASDKNGNYERKTIDIPKDTSLKIAHPLDLYNSNKWHIYQKDLFARQIKQPFKQVFRELYLKTADELGKTNSLRYAGHQIQPQKTIGLLKTRRWVVDPEEGLQKVYYKENIIAKIYALADWFSPSEIEAPTLEWVCFYERKTLKEIKIDDIPDIIFSEVMRDVDLAVSVAYVGGVDPQTSHSTVQMRKAIISFNLELFKLENVTFSDNFAIISGKRADYTIHLGSGIIHQKAGSVINVLPVHSQQRGKLFLPFIDEDPKTAEIISKIVLFAQDTKIKDPSILEQIKHNK